MGIPESRNRTMIRHRVLILDSANRRLLWKQAIKRATAGPQIPIIPWWKRALAFLDRVWM